MVQQVTCSRLPLAYHPPVDGDPRALFNLRDRNHVQLVETTTASLDGLPVFVDNGCGRTFDFSAPRSGWDISTSEDGRVIERHIQPTCPHCGATADHLSEAVTSSLLIDEYYDAVRDEELEQLAGDHYRNLSEELKPFARLGQIGWDPSGIGQPPSGRTNFGDGWHLVIEGGADAAYGCNTEGAVALSAATAKTVNGIKAHANSGISVTKFWVAFDGVTASAVPVLIEIGYCTWATNGPGTNSTSTTPRQKYGRALTVGFTSGKTWTSEPTVITVLEEFLLSPNGGVVGYDFPLGTEPDSALAEGLVVRCTAPATVNVRCHMTAKRI